MMYFREALSRWRREQAVQEGVEVFRVLPNAVLEQIIIVLPRTKEEFLAIKGIKEAKFRKYGQAIRALVEEYASGSGALIPQEPVSPNDAHPTQEEAFLPEAPRGPETLSVSQFLDGLNLELSGLAARIRGEVTSVDERERVVYFTLKDSIDESILSCLIFRYQYTLSGVRLAVGDEVIVEGVPEIYKPNGRLSLKVGLIELSGEGALKKAYDELFRKLSQEGLLAPERKRILPEFPERIALITSEQGAAIGDFIMNLGQIGLQVDFYPTSVEGKRAVFEILEAVRFFNQTPERYDLLVMVRGGGSLESLQAFNNETLVRAVAESKIPTLLGIGHEKDVTLAALVADVMVSTPTATARTLREPFERARQSVMHAETLLLERFTRGITLTSSVLLQSQNTLAAVFPKLKERLSQAEQGILRAFEHVRFRVKDIRETLVGSEKNILSSFTLAVDQARHAVTRSEEKLREYDPARALRLGYSLVKMGGQIIRSVKQVKRGDTLALSVQDGTIEAEVRNVTRNL